MYLGIDLGTSGLKLLLMDAAQRRVMTVDMPLSLQQPKPLWCEQAPSDWWAALSAAVTQLRAQAPKDWAAIEAVGLSGQMHCAVVLDEQGQVLRPAMLWNDGRSAQQCADLELAFPQARQITGNLAMPGLTAPKLLWLRQHEPAVFARIARVLLPKDWLRWQLTGDAVSDMSDASGTWWLDVAQRRWHHALLALCGLSEDQMPRLVEGNQVSARLRPALAQAWGLRDGVPVAGGAGDNAASAVGVGAVSPGQGFVSLGTSGVIFRVTAAFAPAPERAIHAFAHALPKRWHQMSVMLSAASALTWLSRLTGQSQARMAASVAKMPPAQRAHAPLFLPYLQGERTPHNRPLLPASFTGLRSDHGPVDLAYAVMEGVGFGLLDGWRAMGEGGPSHRSLALVGGGARSEAWSQLLSSLLQCPLHCSDAAPVAAALGAARLAWMAHTGQSHGPWDDSSHQGVWVPRPEETALLLQRHAQFGDRFAQLHSA